MKRSISLILLVLLALSASACAVTETASAAVNSVLRTETVWSVGESDELSGEQQLLKEKIDGFIETVNGPMLSSTREGMVAYHGTIPKFNTHALVTGAKALLICKAYLDGTYSEIIVYDPAFVDEAQTYYTKTEEAEGTLYAFNKNVVLWIPKVAPGSPTVARAFRAHRF